MLSNHAVQLDDALFVVKNRLGPGREFRSFGSHLTMDGLVLDTTADLAGDQRFLWMEFSTPANERISALGEITERSEAGVSVRFKHLFPDQRRKLAIMLDEQEPTAN